MSGGNEQQIGQVQVKGGSWFHKEDFAIGAAAGATMGGLTALYVRMPVTQPMLRVGIAGGVVACLYRPIARTLEEQRGFDDPTHHALAGGVSGFALGAFMTATERGAGMGGVFGAAAGVGIFFGASTFNEWRYARGRRMVAEREEERFLAAKKKLLMGRSGGVLSRREYEQRLQALEAKYGKVEKQLVATGAEGGTSGVQDTVVGAEKKAWWLSVLDILPMRKVSDEELLQMEVERRRYQAARKMMPGVSDAQLKQSAEEQK